MPRLAIAVAPGVGRVSVVFERFADALEVVAERVDLGVAFEGETPVRLPARLQVGAEGGIEPAPPRYYPRNRRRALRGAQAPGKGSV